MEIQYSSNNNKERTLIKETEGKNIKQQNSKCHPASDRWMDRCIDTYMDKWNIQG